LTTVTTINSTLNLAYQISEKTSTESDFRRVQFDYNSANLVGYTEYNTEDWFNYNLTPALPVSVGGLAGYDAVAVAHRNQTYGQLRVRVRYTLSAKLALDASAGGELRAYDSGQSDTTTPVFSLTASYQLARRTLLSVTGSRQKYAFIFNGYNYLTTGANVYLTQDLTDRFTARASAGVESLQYLTTKHGLKNYTDQFYYARLDVEAKIIRHLTGQMYYSWKTWQSSVNGNVPDNQVGMNLTLKY